MATPPLDPTHPAEDAPFRILVIVSRPLDQKELPEIADQWALYTGLSAVKTPARLDFLRPPTIEQLRTDILGGYDVVHFDGHGAFGLRCPNCSGLNPPESRKCGRCSASLEDEEAGGYLAFEREDGAGDALAAEDLARMINAVPGRPTKLVILSACESAKGGDASLLAVLKRTSIPAVLGMKESVSVDVTVVLSRPFYAYLGAGLEIAEAFRQALPSLKNLPNSKEGTPAQEVPVLEGEGTHARIVDHPMWGEVVVERERIFGVPEYEFVGEFIRYDPPKGRKGLLVRTMRVLLDDEKLVILTGHGGIGKSVLGAEAARRVAWRYPGGVFWRSAADVENLGLNELLDAFARPEVFGYEFRTLPLDAKRDVVLNYLRNMSTASLLVVDNAETIKDDALWRFLEGIPKLSAALVTSREALEREGNHIDIDQMEPSEATQLFIVEARRRKTGWGSKLTETDLAALDEISGHLDGHPLAIKLAAAMVGSDSVTVIRDMLRAAPPREVSKRFDFSYHPLPEGEKELLHRLAAFASSTTEVVIEMTSTLPLFEGDATPALHQWRENLSELVRKSFLDTIDRSSLDESGNEISLLRYRLHPLMRQYASGKAGKVAMNIHHKRAANLFLAYAEQFRDNYNKLQAEHENLLAGMDWSYATEEWKMVTRFMWSVQDYLNTRGYWNEAKFRLGQAIQAAETCGDHLSEGAFANSQAQLLSFQGDLKTAWNSYMLALEIAREFRFEQGEAATLHELGNLALATGNIDEARLLYRDSLKIKQNMGDKSGVSKSLHQLGILAQDTGNIDEARSLYEESLKIAKELGDRRDISKSLHQLGTLAKDTGNIDEARRLYGQSLKIKQELGDKNGVGITLHQLGMLARDTGNIDEAQSLCEESLKIAKELGDRRGISRSLHQLGMLMQITGENWEAQRLYGDSLKIAKELGDKSAVLRSLGQLGILAQVTGNIDEARRLYDESLKIAKELGDKSAVSKSLHQMGILAQDTGNIDEARRLYDESLKIAKDLGDKSAVSKSLHQMGILAQDADDIGEARSLYEESLKIAKELGDKNAISRSLHQLSIVTYLQGDIDKALSFNGESLKIFQDIGDKSGVASALAQSAILEEIDGNLGQALDLIRRAEMMFLELKSPTADQARQQRERLEQNIHDE